VPLDIEAALLEEILQFVQSEERVFGMSPMQEAIKFGNEATIWFLDEEFPALPEHPLTLLNNILPPWNMVQNP
jgi:hypothetical protein